MMLEIFNSKKYDDEVFLISEKKQYTLGEIKEIIAYNIDFLKNKSEDIVILPDDNFNFVISFFSGIFADKNIILITDKHRLKDIKEKYLILDINKKNIKKDYKFKKPDINKPSITFFTSGSTGKPKGIKKTLSNLIEEGRDVASEFSLNGQKFIVSSTTTMCHLFGLTFHLFFPLCSRNIINTDNILYPEHLDIENCFLVSTPAFLNIIERHNEKFKKNPLFIVSAGSKLPYETFKYIEKKSKIIEIYGSTETGVIAYRRKSNEKEFKIFPKVKIKKINGEFFLKTNYTYEQNIKLDDDIELKEDKILIKERKDRIIKIFDKRISAPEIENMLENHPFVEKSYCFKEDDKLAAFLALSSNGKDFLIKNGMVKLKKELKEFLIEKTEIIPQKWRFSDEIPMKITGKIDKEKINAIFNLNTSLPIILNREIKENEIIYSLFFYKNCTFYKGHFPNFPITPGVVQLYLASILGEYHFQKKLTAGQIKKIKFSNIMKADSIVNLKLEKREDYVIFTYYKDDITYSSGNLPCKNILINGENL